MWYWYLNIAGALWVFFDSRKRKMDNSIPWSIGTAIFMIFVIPFYFAKRPLYDNEVREGGTAWNVIRTFGMFWTLFMFIAGMSGMVAASKVTAQVGSSAERAGAAIGTALGVGVIMGLWFAVLVGSFVIGFFLKKSSIVEKGPTGPLKKTPVHEAS